MGVVLNRAEGTISFTKNGVDLGVAFDGVPDRPLHATVGMRTPGEEVLANFGATPFVGDAAAIQADAGTRAAATPEATATGAGLVDS